MGRSTTNSSSTSSLSSSHTPSIEDTSLAATMPPKKIVKKEPPTKAKPAQSKIIVLKLASAKLATFKETAIMPPPPSISTSNNSINGSSANSPRNPSPLAASATPQVGSPGSEAASVQATGSKPGPKRGRQPGAAPAKPGRKKQKLSVSRMFIYNVIVY